MDIGIACRDSKFVRRGAVDISSRLLPSIPCNVECVDYGLTFEAATTSFHAVNNHEVRRQDIRRDNGFLYEAGPY